MTDTDASAICPHCGMSNAHVGPCPRIVAMEYYPDGTIKRVEYRQSSQLDANISPIIPDIRTTGWHDDRH